MTITGKDNLWKQLRQEIAHTLVLSLERLQQIFVSNTDLMRTDCSTYRTVGPTQKHYQAQGCTSGIFFTRKPILKPCGHRRMQKYTTKILSLWDWTDGFGTGEGELPPGSHQVWR